MPVPARMVCQRGLRERHIRPASSGRMEQRLALVDRSSSAHTEESPPHLKREIDRTLAALLPTLGISVSA
ncbi:MAG: hypothetical protein ACYDGR_11435 [Candidatus Dormibacteria bacterium]